MCILKGYCAIVTLAFIGLAILLFPFLAAPLASRHDEQLDSCEGAWTVLNNACDIQLALILISYSPCYFITFLAFVTFFVLFQAALDALRSAGVNDARWTAAVLKPKHHRAYTSSIVSPPSTPPSPLSPLSPSTPSASDLPHYSSFSSSALSPIPTPKKRMSFQSGVRSPTSPSPASSIGGGLRGSVMTGGMSSAQKRALEEQAVENQRALRTAAADGSAVRKLLAY